jgi:hypothetical protein
MDGGLIMSEAEHHQQQLEQQEQADLQKSILAEAWFALLTANCLPIEMVEVRVEDHFIVKADGRTFKISIKEL